MNPIDYDIYNTNRTALKPCPFCGSSPHIVYLDDELEDTDGYHDSTEYAAVQCDGCHTSMLHMILRYEETAELAERWNRRV